MGKLRRNYSKSFQHVQDRFIVEAGKLFEKEHQGRECTNAVFIRVLFCALCHIQSLFAVCRNLQKCPDDRTVAVAILKTLPKYDKFQKRINEVLAEGLPKNLQRGKQRLAIDLVLIPYHGLPQHSESEIYRSQPKSGTSHFHAYATCCVIKKGFRYTVALTPVTKGEEMKVVLQRLLKQCKDIGLKCGLLLVDRGFYSVSVISYLKHAQVPFMMPVVIRGKKATKNTLAGGTRKYASWKKSGFDKYEISTVKNKKKTSTWFYVGVYCKNLRGERGKHGRKAFTFAYYGVDVNRARWMFETYRKRFGIETSYRQMHECRIRTSTRKPILRLLYFALAMLMRNCWLWFERVCVTENGRRKQTRDDYISFRDILLRLYKSLENDLAKLAWSR
jgi:putative transposase